MPATANNRTPKRRGMSLLSGIRQFVIKKLTRKKSALRQKCKQKHTHRSEQQEQRMSV